jgi:hypothetical protein
LDVEARLGHQTGRIPTEFPPFVAVLLPSVANALDFRKDSTIVDSQQKKENSYGEQDCE